VAVALAGPYASLHLSPDRQTAPHHSVFTGRMPFLPPNQQRQSTEGTVLTVIPINNNWMASLELLLTLAGRFLVS